MQVTVRGIPVHYVEVGDGRPVLLLHGSPGDHRQLTYHFEPIFAARRGWRRIYPDMPGMGQTPGADWITCQDDMLEVALGFAEAVVRGERLTVIGASWGGYIGLGMVHKRGADLDGLMLLAPMLKASGLDVPPPQVLVRDAEAEAAVEPDEQLWARNAVVQTPEMLAAFRAAVKPGVLASDRGFLARVGERASFSFDPTRPAAPFQAPVLILAARQDPMVGYRDAWGLLEQFPRATYAVLDRAGHGVSAEQRGLFRALTNEWLDRVEEQSP